MTEARRRPYVKLAREDEKLHSSKQKTATKDKYGLEKENNRSQYQNEKVLKDCNRPKKPLSPYFLFHHSKAEGIKAANPTYSISDISKVTGAQWRALSDEQIAPFKEEAKKLAEIYKKEMAQYEKEKLK